MAAPQQSADPALMSIADIKNELRVAYDIADTSDCLEKSDLVRRLQSSRANGAVLDLGGFEYGEVLRIGNRVNPSGVVTLSHGLGDSARGWEDVANELAAKHTHLLFVLPTAPKMPVTINMGSIMNAWYDIKSLGNPSAAQDPNILKTAAYVTSLARQAANKYRIPTSRIVFGGFSQGAALSLVSGLTSSFRPAAVMMLSGYFAAAEHVIPKLVNKDFPILMCHGTQDNVLPIQLAEMSKSKLQGLGFNNIQYHTYPMQHSVHPRELTTISEFIASVLPSTT